MQLSYQVFSSPLGQILVAGNSEGLTHVRRGTNRARLIAEFTKKNEAKNGGSAVLNKACGAILAYLEGKSARLEVPLAMKGTPFQRKVWQALSRIPYGATLSYSDVAEKIGAPSAFRAVANACGDNPIPLIIPCHRVVHKSGNVSGFAWGVECKRFLLELEQSRASQGSRKAA